MSQLSSPLTTTPPAGVVGQPLSPIDLSTEIRSSSPSVPRELQIPQFARKLAKPLSLKEDLGKLPRKPFPLSFSSLPIPPRTDDLKNRNELDPTSNEMSFYIMRNVSGRFTESSLRSFLGSESNVGFLRYRVLSVNEYKGRFEPAIVPQQVLTIPGTAIALTRSGVSYMLAYAEKSTFQPLESASSVLLMIFDDLTKRYISTADQTAGSGASGALKFGGGLGRKSAGNQPSRYILRAPIGLLSDDDWKTRGAAAVESDSQWTVAKFTRIEIRDSACDSFIVGIELSTPSNPVKRFEIGISSIKGRMVFIENLEHATDGVPPFRQVEAEIFFH